MVRARTKPMALAWMFLCIVGSSVMGQAQPVITLVQEGTPTAVIVVGKKASTTEQYAAEELQLFLEKISGAKVPIQVEGEAKTKATRIVIGTPKTSQSVADSGLIAESSLGRDGIRIKTADNTIILAGENPPGALYATYAFLEEHLGVRWYFPGEKGEYVPPMTTLAIGQIDDTQKPAFPVRGLHPVAHNTTDPELPIWMARNRMNYINQMIIAPHHGAKLKRSMKQGMIASTATHFSHFLQFGKLFEAHPEYFPLLNGKRSQGFPSGYVEGQLQQHNYCLSNRDAVKEVAKAIRALVTRYPELEMIGINQMDSVKWCECAACKALGTPTDRLHTFINRLVEELGPVLDNRFLTTQAYLGTDRHPVKVKPNAKVIIFFALISHCARHGWNENCPTQEKQKKNLAGWLKYGNKVVAYTYHAEFAPGFPSALASHSLADIKFYNSIGMAGWFPEMVMDAPGQYPLKRDPELLWGDGMYSRKLMYYAGIKALWNPNITLEELKSDYFPRFYGKAGPAMRKYYDTFETAWKKPGDVRYFHIRLLNYNPSMFVDFLSPALVTELRGYLSQAEKDGANESEVIKGRIERDSLLFAKWEKRYKDTGGKATRR